MALFLILLLKFAVFLLLLLFVLLPSAVCRSLDATFNDDVLGLIVFKAALDGDPFAKLESWNEDDRDPCNWVGVKCDPDTSRVTDLSLSGFSLSGRLGRGLLRLTFLQSLSLSDNNFTGAINPDFSQLAYLENVDFSGNGLNGSIPDRFFSHCGSLKSVSFARNRLDGEIPQSLSSCSTLVYVNLSSNQISGKLPSAIWSLKRLERIDFSGNLLEGVIPQGIGNPGALQEIKFSRNRLSGHIPEDIGDCSSLRLVDFSENLFSGTLPDSMQKLGGCKSVNLGGNLLTGNVPDWIGEKLNSLEILDLSKNNFSGEVPFSIGNLEWLKELNLSMNQFIGELPESMGNCHNLLALDVSKNQVSGNFHSWLFNSGLRPLSLTGRGLQLLDLSSNALSGEILSDVGVLSSLVELNLSGNHLSGLIPVSIGGLKAIEIIDLSENQLNGSIPSEIAGAVSLKELRLLKNFLSGEIPPQIASCSSLTSLILSQNNLSGPVPLAIANLSNLQFVDLSQNDLAGGFPKELANLHHLVLFNVSHNHLSGELPDGGFFDTIPPSSVSGNPAVCGSAVNRSCPAVHSKPLVLNPNSSNSLGVSSASHCGKKTVLSTSALIAIVAAAFIIVGVVAITLLNVHVRSSKSQAPTAFTLSGGEEFSSSPTNDPNHGKLVMFSGKAELVADSGEHALLNKDCEIGRGGFGVVYRTVLRDGRSVAIKKLTVPGLVKSQEEFEREVKKLAKIRHKNLVALEGYYWTPSLQLLIYEFVSSGSLCTYLHDGVDGSCLSWQQRFNLIIGIARAVAYLHHLHIIHYNLKSSNVLIDESGEAKVGDFGVTRLLSTSERSNLSSRIPNSLGYFAPELSCKAVKVTDKCDVYAFGVLVLETVTGKRPVEYMEDDVVVLCEAVRAAVEEGGVEECVDERLRGKFLEEEVVPVIKLGLICASQVPSSRPDMDEVINILQMIHSPCNSQEELE